MNIASLKQGKHQHQYQRGVAVITALLLTALAITLVASLFWQQQVQVRSIENQRLQLQTQWILRGALDWARLILQEDAKHSSVDTLDEPWAIELAETRLDQYVENSRSDSDQTDAVLFGRIVDAQALYNLNNLLISTSNASSKGLPDPVEVAVFARLLRNLNLAPELAQATANAMAASVRRTANTDVASATTQTTAVSLPFAHNEDLLAVPGFSNEILRVLKDYVIFLPEQTTVNVNTASAVVLAARIPNLSLEGAKSMVAERERLTFKDVSDFVTRVSGKQTSNTGTTADYKISTDTHYFIVNGRVRLNRATMEMRALLARPGAFSGTTVKWIREE